MNYNQLKIKSTMEGTVCRDGSEVLPNLEDDLLDAEVSDLFHNYLQMSEMNMRDSGIRLDSSDSSSTCSSLLPLTPLERLIRTHPIWFLPEVDREEAAAILHTKETGNFLVGRSSQYKTALSVKLGAQHGFEVDTFILKEEKGKVTLLSSFLEFDNILSLVHHYNSHSEELPVQLSLPSILQQTEGRQCLSSLALLGRDFWRYPMSNPGRQSLMLLDADTRTLQEKNNHTRTFKQLSLISQRDTILPAQEKQMRDFSILNVAPTIHPIRRHSVPRNISNVILKEIRCEQRITEDFAQSCEKIELSKSRCDTLSYFKSPTNDKMSDYEDIWEKTPGPESPNQDQCDGIISPTLSEKRFKQFLFNRFFDQNYSTVPEITMEESTIKLEPEDFNHTEILPSYTSCSSSSPSPCSSSSASFSSNSVESSDIHSDTSEYSDPLEALEQLTDTAVEETNNEFEEELYISYGKPTNDMENVINWNKDLNYSGIETSHSLTDLPSNIDHKEEPAKQGPIGGLLRKLSIKRKPSVTRSKYKQQNRLSAVIGCYLTHSSLERNDGENCQVDSSSWEFLDQNEKPKVEYFEEIRKQVKLNSESIDILSPSKTNCTQTNNHNNTTFDEEEAACDDSSIEKVYYRDTSANQGILDQPISTINMTNPSQMVIVNYCDSSKTIKDYITDLATKDDSILGQTIKQFIICTEDSSLKDPILVMRNMRQVMNGLKNYLINTGEGEFFQLLKLLKAKLSPDKFLDLDTILEDVMQGLIVRPLRKHLDLLFCQDFTQSGCIQLLSENIAFGLSLSYRDFSIPEEFEQNLISLVEISKNALTRMRDTFSPSDKLTCFLEIIDHVTRSVFPPLSISLPTLSSILCYLIVQTNCDNMEMECEFMWGLLSSSLLRKEGGYYLSLLSCAIHMLKNITNQSGFLTLSSMSTSPLLQIFVPDDQTDCLVQRTVPIRPEMTVKEVTRYLQGSSNSQGDWALFTCQGGTDTLLENERKIQELMAECSDRSVAFVFKQREMKLFYTDRRI